MTKLLEDLVFFVCVVPNNGQDVLSVVTATPNRERQKLMREQNILAQVSKSTHTVALTLFCLPSYDLHGISEGYYHRQSPQNELLIMHVNAHKAFFFSCPVQMYSARVKCVLPNSDFNYAEGEKFMS